MKVYVVTAETFNGMYSTLLGVTDVFLSREKAEKFAEEQRKASDKLVEKYNCDPTYYGVLEFDAK